MPDLELSFSLPPGRGLHEAVDRALFSLAAVPDNGTEDEYHDALRAAAARFRAAARALDDAAIDLGDDDR